MNVGYVPRRFEKIKTMKGPFKTRALKGRPAAFFVMSLITLAVTSCFNPIGFMPDVLKPPESNIAGNGPGSAGSETLSSPDNPHTNPDPDKGIIIFKNLSGGEKAMAATFAVTGQEHTTVNASVALGSGQERSMSLLPGHYSITITFSGDGSPITGSKALLAGRVEYVYFYVGKDGAYKGGINVNSDHVYGDINLSYYQDNENTGDNGDGDTVSKPREGDVSADNAPREKLPGAMRENYGIALVHNLSASMPLLKVTFDHYTNDIAGGPDLDSHWEMNPGPDKGNRKSIILRPGAWKVRAIWIDPADASCAGGSISTAMVKAGAANHINHLFFYKGTDGKYYLTDEPNSAVWSPAIDGPDYLNHENAGGNGVIPNHEGQITNENESIIVGGSSWDPYRDTYGVAVVRNLSSKVQITKVTFTRDGDASRKYVMGTIDVRNNRSMILEKGPWHVVVDYAWGSHASSKALANPLDVKAVGFTGIKTHVYFYYADNGNNTWEIDADYHVEGGINAPPAYQDEGGGGSAGGAGVSEGDSPGSLTENNRKNLGLVVLKNLAKNADIDDARFKQQTKNFPLSPMAIPRSNQRSILLGNGDWAYYIDYSSDTKKAGRVPGGTTTNTVTIAAGHLYTLYFYQDTTGNYAVTDVWPPVWPALPPLTDGNMAPISDNEGYLHIKNDSSGTILTKLSYKHNGTDTEMNFPGNIQLVPGAETANSVILPVGTATVKFYNGIKQRWSGAIPVNIKERQTFKVIYTDGMDIADLPDGYGMVRVTNKSIEAVQSAIFYDPKMVAHPESFTLVSGDTDSVRVPLGAYVARFKLESFTAEFIVTLDNGTNRIVAVTITDQTVTDKSNVGNPNKAEGGIRVHNAYPINSGSAAYLDTKVFKYYLYEAIVDPVTGKHTYGSSPGYTFDGTQPYNPIARGQNENIPAVNPGFYKLEIVAGSYPWPSYREGLVIGGLTLSEKLITYDCGEVLIVAGQERQYYFNNHNNEKDTPNGYVTFTLTMSENDNTYAMVHFEMAVRPKKTMAPADFNSIYANPWTSSLPKPETRLYANWPGSWTGAAQGPYAPKEDLIFEWGGVLNSFSNQAGPFAIPPGIYWTRYNDNHTIGYARGAGNDTHWRLIDLRAYARQHVNCSSDHTVGTNWAPVPQL
jgi:hypothetical protein